jgi:hypothetical protein
MRGVVVSIAFAAACGAQVDGNNNRPDAAPTVDSSGSADAPSDAFVLGDFGPPQKITVAADPAKAEDDSTLSYSGLELVFARVDPNDANHKHLFYASRPDLASAFTNLISLPFSTAGTDQETPRFTADDLTLFFAKTNGTNGLDIFSVTRPTAGSQQWGNPSIVAGVNTTATEKWFMPCDNNRYLVIVGAHISEGVLGQGLPAAVPELAAMTGSETGTFLTQDCLTITFASTRNTTNELFTSTRTAIGSPFSPPAQITFFQALGGNQQDPFISTDQRTFTFVSDIGGTNDVYISTR